MQLNGNNASLLSVLISFLVLRNETEIKKKLCMFNSRHVRQNLPYTSPRETFEPRERSRSDERQAPAQSELLFIYLLTNKNCDFISNFIRKLRSAPDQRC